MPETLEKTETMLRVEEKPDDAGFRVFVDNRYCPLECPFLGRENLRTVDRKRSIPIKPRHFLIRSLFALIGRKDNRMPKLETVKVQEGIRRCDFTAFVGEVPMEELLDQVLSMDPELDSCPQDLGCRSDIMVGFGDRGGHPHAFITIGEKQLEPMPRDLD